MSKSSPSQASPNSPSQALLKALSLSHSFDYPLFQDLSFSLHARKSLAIVGASGCGKSTLLHILSSLLPPKSGQVFYKNQDLYAQSPIEQGLIRRHDFGIIFQQHFLFKGFSARENIELASVLSGKALDPAILKRLDIENILDQKIGTLSGGQQQRISIARVLSKKPRIIFADEPTGNLDPHNAQNIIELLQEHAKEHEAALVLVTHDGELAALCDECIRL